MPSVKKPTWQQATALMSLSTCGAMTGFTFARGTVTDMTSPTSMPAHLLALDKPAAPAPPQAASASSRAASASSDDSALRSAIVRVAYHYLQLAQARTPAEMEALIWHVDSVDGVDHGQSCAAFASLTLALGANVAGQQSWATGGGSYPWPLHQWADVRVQPNPASPDVISMLQDAQAHHRWHPLGDGYRPQPGDWVLFDGHVEVVTRYTGGALYTVGGDSLPNFTVNAHTFTAPLAAQGVLGFVNNGDLASTVAPSAGAGAQAEANTARVPGLLPQLVATAAEGAVHQGAVHQGAVGQGAVGQGAVGQGAVGQGAAGQGGTHQAAPTSNPAIPGVLASTSGGGSAGPRAPAYLRHDQQPTGGPGTAAQQAFISLVAPGAIAAEQRYGIPAAVTIAQAIDESGWGQSELATADHNLFGIKGTGPAGSDMRPTREYENGVWVTLAAPFRVYRNVAESIEDHSQLLATGPAYRHAMANRHDPDAFAAALTGVYATDPDYGSNLVALMRLYHLYRYDAVTPAGSQATAPPEPRVTGQQAAVPGVWAPTGRASAGLPGVAGALAAGVARTRRTREPGRRARPGPRPEPRSAPRGSRTSGRRYVSQIPYAVSADFVARAKAPLTRARPLYQDVASYTGIGWELLAACDWMQCQAQPRYSPVHGEKLGTANPDGTVFRSKSAALTQCASDLIELSDAVYLISLTARRALSVRELANVFAAFRWGGLLRAHDISAMEFPYSVAGLTVQHLKMRWPDIDDPDAPDKPGARFRMPFGALPVVLSLGYKAVA